MENIIKSIEITEKQLNTWEKLKEQDKKGLKIANQNENKEAAKYFRKQIKNDNEAIKSLKEHLEYLKSIDVD